MFKTSTNPSGILRRFLHVTSLATGFLVSFTAVSFTTVWADAAGVSPLITDQLAPTLPHAAPAESAALDTAPLLGNPQDATAQDATALQVMPPVQEQRVQQLHEQIEKRAMRLKRLMSSCGVEDESLQNTVIAHLKEEVVARQQVREQVDRLFRSLRDKNTSDEELHSLTSELHATLEFDHQRRRKADDLLNERIGYRQNPRCEAMLLVFGVIGDGPLMILAAPGRGHRKNLAGLSPEDHVRADAQRRQQMPQPFGNEPAGNSTAGITGDVVLQPQEPAVLQPQENLVQPDHPVQP